MQGGGWYARCIPSGNSGFEGYTEICRVGMEKDERLTRYDWYSSGGVVLGWSPISGEIAIMAKRRVPAESLDKQIELSFHSGGRHLRSWTAAELKELGCTIGFVKEEGSAIRVAEFQLGDCEQVDNSNEYVFNVKFWNGKHVAFDVLTGDVYRPHKLGREEVRRIADDVGRTRGIKLEDFECTNTGFDARKGGWYVHYLHKPPGYLGGHFTVFVNDETKETRFFGGR